MAEKYEEDISMVNEDDEEEQLVFINYQIWPEDGVIDTKSKKFKYAKKLLKKLVDAGNPRAMNELGAMYYEGRTVDQNYKKAVQWYKKAADAGCDVAMSNLGYAYFYGNGVKVDTYLAFKYFTMAAHRGNLDAVVKLGDMYREGICVNKDERMAFELYNQCYENAPHDASTNAYPSCLIKIGECLAQGLGVNEDVNTARGLFREAKAILLRQMACGDHFAGVYLDRVDRNLEIYDWCEEENDRILKDLARISSEYSNTGGNQ